MIKCIIVDDEQHAIDILVHYVNQTPHLELVASFTNPIEALQLLTKQKIDLVFLDIQMPELSGIDFIKAIQGKSKVILTTAYSEFALEGYELYVVDYLMKPIRLARFLAAVQKAMEQINIHESTKPESTEDDYIFVKTESKGKLLKINLADIDFIESMKNYVAIYRAGQKTLVYTSMKELEEHLSKKQFIRVHKSFIIPIARVTGIEGNLVKLKNVTAEILIGDSYKAELMEIIRGKMIQ
ncbi:MAG TPA: LytTR family DNA-binding domain-containing protein [Chitinophagaceae bacterium]|nr:LytTR family DNA-binding domain-containing protein [Chitinophagaceae bacterium]